MKWKESVKQQYVHANIANLYSFFWTSGPIGPAGLPGSPGKRIFFFYKTKRVKS